MFDTLRDNSKIIVYIVVVAFVISGGFMGYGAYLNNQGGGGGQSPNQNPSVIAEVNGMEVSQQEYFSMLQQQAPQSNLNNSQIIPFRYNVLNSLIERKLILAQAEELDLNVEVSESEIDENYENILEQNEMTDQELADRLAEQDATIGDLRDNIESSLKDQKTITQTIDQGIEAIEVTDAEIEELYNQRYPEPESGEDADAESSNTEDNAEAAEESEERPEMAEVRDDLESEIRGQKRNEAVNNWLSELKAEAEITINDPVLKAYHALENENYDQAAEQFSSLVEQEETDPMFYSYLAQAYQGQNNYDQAEKVYNNALEDFPENNDLKFNYAEFLADQEKEEEAIAQLDSISETAEGDFMTYYQLFILYNQLGAEEKAQSAMQEVQEISQSMQQNESETEVDEETTDQIEDEAEEIEEDLEVESPVDTEGNN